MSREEQAKEFGAWVRAQRERLGLSIDGACKLVDGRISRQRWTDYEKGGRMTRGKWVVANASPKLLHLVARALQLPVDEVFERAGVTPPGPSSVVVASDPDGESLMSALQEGFAALLEETRAQADELRELRSEVAALRQEGRKNTPLGAAPAQRGGKRSPS